MNMTYLRRGWSSKNVEIYIYIYYIYIDIVIFPIVFFSDLCKGSLLVQYARIKMYKTYMYGFVWKYDAPKIQ